MTDTIIVALITGGISLLGVIVSNVATHRKTMALIEYKLNHLVERMAAVESSTKSAHHRLDGLEQSIRRE